MYFNVCDNYFKTSRIGKFWNMAKMSKNSFNYNNNNNMSMENLYYHFRDKFSYNEAQANDYFKVARLSVIKQLEKNKFDSINLFVFTEFKL